MACWRFVIVNSARKGDNRDDDDDDDDDNNNNNNNNMEFGLEKCAKITFKRGKLTHKI